jgi:CheY-like chemotaxis protein
VDDERPIAATVADVVEDLGYRVSVAAHGQDALNLARTAWPALVITDLVMPQLNGAGLIAALHQEAATQGRTHVPVILMTAAGMESACQAGADAVLRKPFDLEELEHLVTQFLPH